jgi:hypothetical protein
MSDSTSGLRRGSSSGLWQALIKAAGLAVAFCLLGLFVAGVPVRARQLVTVVAEGDAVIFPGVPPTVAPVYTSRLGPAEAEALETLGLAPGFYAAYLLTFEIGLAAACAAVGLFIFWRRAEGWLTVWVALMLVLLGTTAVSPEIYTLIVGWAGWGLFGPAVGLLGMVSFLHILYLAPDGRFVPRWTLRLAAGYAGGALGLMVQFVRDIREGQFFVGFFTAIMVWLGLSAVGAGGQVYRYWHVSGPVERQQIKWVIAGLMAVTLGTVINSALFFPASQASGMARVLFYLARTTLVTLCLLALPVSLAFSILRYRLWDIDLIIRRTLVYASLTAALLLVYLSSVVVLQAVVGGLAGADQPALVTVLSTLAIAALFVPLRRRLQDGIDRRFFRHKYDAARVLAAFGASLRDEPHLDRLSAKLIGVVDETMEPASVGLWLRTGKGG